MVSFTPQFLDEIRARLSVSSVVGRRVKLMRRGREQVGLSPFSNERTPSFTVNDDKGFYHCFSTGEHGDVITFVMKTQNLTFPEAVERLAEEAGLEMPRQSAQEAQQQARSATLRDAVEMACLIYERALWGPEGRAALAYLRSRGLSDEIIRRFRLGYAAGSLKQELLKKGLPEEILLEARLISPGKEGRDSFDFFRDRVMFPICDLRGRPIAFGGRVMGDGAPKYLNSPDTPLFHKGQIVYAFSLAREAAAKKQEIIAVEGYMDVIALAQAGFDNAVAPLGTAMTEAQMELLWRIAPEPILCFDGDKAGQGASRRAADRAVPLLKPGFSLRFAILPQGKDPDDICRRDGPQVMREYLNGALPLSEVLWRQLTEDYASDTPERKAALKSAAEGLTNKIGDEAVRNQYFRMFKDRLYQHLKPQYQPRFYKFAAGFHPSSHIRPPRRPTRAVDRFPQTGPSVSANIQGVNGQQVRHAILLATLITHPPIFDHVEERLGSMTFFDVRLDSLRQIAVSHVAENPELDFEPLSTQLAAIGYALEVANLLHPQVFQHAAFARPSAPLDQATVGWDHTFALCHRDELEADLNWAELELVKNSTLDALAAKEAVLRQIADFHMQNDAVLI